MRYLAYCRKSSEGEDRQALSIPAQIDEINRAFKDAHDVEITGWLEEKMSAKSPGRPVYSEMIKRIERGEADGIVAWHPDRLARNSVDGGWLIHLVDRGIVKDLKFVSYSFEKSPQGMFMLQIMFGQSKYYVDALSVNVKRGMRKKIETGWWANLAPLGYRNDKENNTIVVDPVPFAIIRRMWELFLTGTYRVTQLQHMANEEWGFRTPVRKNSGGKKLTRSGAYRIFSSPFYAGILQWQGQRVPGKHVAMITLEEFEQGRRLLGKTGCTKPVVHEFAYTGLIRCACGLAITAEEKRKKSGRRYVYYHCTRRAQPVCTEPAVRAELLDAAIAATLQASILPACVEDFLRETVADRDVAMDPSDTGTAIESTRLQLSALTDMRLRNLMDDGEYLERKKKLQEALATLESAAAAGERKDALRLELAEAVGLLRKHGPIWFFDGTNQDKRLILRCLGSNPVLSNKRLSICASVPFECDADPAYSPRWLATMDAIGTIDRIVRSVAALKARAEARSTGATMPVVEGSRKAPRGRNAWRDRERAKGGRS